MEDRVAGLPGALALGDDVEDLGERGWVLGGFIFWRLSDSRVRKHF